MFVFFIYLPIVQQATNSPSYFLTLSTYLHTYLPTYLLPHIIYLLAYMINVFYKLPIVLIYLPTLLNNDLWV
jgi:hypothetical protein